MKKLLSILFAIAFSANFLQAQIAKDIVDYANPKEYIIGGIKVTGTEFLDKDIIILLAGIRVGDRVQIPGSDISKSIETLWKQNLLADATVNISRISGDTAFLEYVLVEKPRLSSFTFKGIKKGEQDDLRDKIKLNKGKVLTDNILVNTKNIIEDYYLDKGYKKSKVTLTTVADTVMKNALILYIFIDKGPRIKIEDIVFTGNTDYKESRLRRLMKKTKENTWYSLFNVSKFMEKDYKDDKNSIVAFYNKKGFRDAKIAMDSVKYDEKGNIVIKINLSEGNKYYFRNITWKGNTKYRSGILDTILNIKKGDIYNNEAFQRRLSADPNGTDVSSLYLDDGYLFFSATPVETSVENDSIDIEIRVYEGPQAIINQVNIYGNDKTNERVIRRAIRTLPGNKFSRADVIRSNREIAQLGFFDPEKIQITPIPHPENGTVDINYTVSEKPSDQLELSAGYGGAAFGVTGSLGVKFNNYSLRNMFTKGGWQPIPSGDGQQLGIRAQSNGRFYQSYNISFTEPWLGGKKPNSLSMAIYRSRITTGVTKENAAYGYLITNGVSLGFGKQLKWPDDFFSFVSSVDYQNYKLSNYNTNSFIITDGTANALSFKQTIARNSLNDPIFPTGGSNVSFAFQFTPPFSLINGRDYANTENGVKYKWIEYHKYRFTADWYTPVIGKNLVLRATAKLGYLGFYNKDIGLSPFERFYLGGDGLSGGNLIYGQDIISLRGYDVLGGNGFQGASIFNKYSMELRYPFSKNPSAYIFGLLFAEAGNQWSTFDSYDPFNLYRTAGVGVRFLLPAFGLLGFNYGIGFDPKGIDSITGKALNLGQLISQRGKFTIVLGFEPE